MEKISTNLLNILGGNFVIMTFEQMDEFDQLKKKECEGSYSYLKRGDLLEEFMSDRDEIPCLITKFGFTYFRFHATLIDELIEWIYEKRKDCNQRKGL